jgi:hypothetical protein
MAAEKKTKEKKEKPAAEKAEAKPVTEAKTEVAEGKTETPAEAKSEAKNYHRGEGQKAVTQAYKDNWNTIFGKKKR